VSVARQRRHRPGIIQRTPQVRGPTRRLAVRILQMMLSFRARNSVMFLLPGYFSAFRDLLNEFSELPPRFRHLQKQRLVAIVCRRPRYQKAFGRMAPVSLDGTHSTPPPAHIRMPRSRETPWRPFGSTAGLITLAKYAETRCRSDGLTGHSIFEMLLAFSGAASTPRKCRHFFR
jgi:hypothetical protein